MLLLWSETSIYIIYEREERQNASIVAVQTLLVLLIFQGTLDPSELLGPTRPDFGLLGPGTTAESDGLAGLLESEVENMDPLKIYTENSWTILFGCQTNRSSVGDSPATPRQDGPGISINININQYMILQIMKADRWIPVPLKRPRWTQVDLPSLP